ncbi:MAG: protein kinase [Heteroscytonema crispum UTEX LB 1556]
MIHHMIGRILQGRYQIVQSLGAGVFGQTYIAVDIGRTENPKCVVKQLKVTSSQPSYLQTLRLRFLTETETLKQLGHHNQIPELIACFEENERFYLVQEFVEGHPLTAELPTTTQWGNLWSESEVIQFLQDVLGVLEFVHSQGLIHCDIKPENLIRRASDGKLVVIDFGSIQPIDFGADSVLPIYRIPVTSLGYIPPEQFISQTQPNSDIYALGMIAIQALTGLAPLQLKVDIYTNEILWRSQNTPVSDYLAAILSQMIRYDFKNRFGSASEVLGILKQIPLENSHLQTVDAHYSVSQDLGTGGDSSRLGSAAAKSSPLLTGMKVGLAAKDAHYSVSQDLGTGDDSSRLGSAAAKSSPLLTGMKVGLAANSLMMGFGVYSLVNISPAYSETETLYKATEQYQAGDLDKAIALAKTIPAHSNVYPEAQATIEEWQQQWQIAAEQYKLAQKADDEGRWADALRAASRVSDILYWQSKLDKIVEHAHANVEVQTQSLLSKAYKKAEVKDFSTALNYLSQIPRESSAGAIVQQKLTEYRHKRGVRASYFLQKAYTKASAGDLDGAVELLQQVPKGTSVYTQAQAKLVEYRSKQRLQANGHKQETASVAKVSPLKQNSTVSSANSTAVVKNTDSFINSKTSTSLKDFDPGNYMQEVNIR